MKFKAMRDKRARLGHFADAGLSKCTQKCTQIAFLKISADLKNARSACTAAIFAIDRNPEPDS
jgi:hypothetical protein